MNQRIAFYVIAILAGIGIISAMFRNPSSIIIPLLVFGVLFLLWKFPPDRWKRTKKPHTHGHPPRQSHRRANKANLRVIPGYKKDDDEQMPKYH